MKISYQSILIVLFLLPVFGKAQQLDQRIPASAEAVMTINGGQLFNAFSVEKFNTSMLGQEMIKEMKRELPSFSGLEDFGINLNQKGHFYYQNDQNINYFSFLFSIVDHSKFSAFFKKVAEHEELITWEGNTVMVERDATIIFDNNTLQILFSDVPYTYYESRREELEKKYPGEDEYDIKGKVFKELILNKAKSNFKSTRSIMTNSSYTANLDKDASASAWINNYGTLMNGYYQMLFGYQMNYDGGMNEFPDLSNTGLGTMSAHLYFNQDNMQIKSSMNFSDDLKSSLKSIYKQKMNKSFYKYVNLDTALGFMSYSVNTENMFNEYPDLLARMYGGMLPSYGLEMEVGADLLSTILDEKAIGELLTGNALFVLDDISEKEVEYITYEYDDEYNEKKVTKKQKEILPDFTLILGTERKDLAIKLAQLGVKYEVLTGSSNQFKVTQNSDIPFPMYLALTDDAIIVSTNLITLGNSTQGTSKAMQKRISKNAMMWHLDIEKIMQKTPVEEMGMDAVSIRRIVENLKSATMTSSKIKGNTVHSNFTITAPNTGKNSLQLLMEFFDEVMQ